MIYTHPIHAITALVTLYLVWGQFEWNIFLPVSQCMLRFDMKFFTIGQIQFACSIF